jgi:hypothetical protein
LDENPNYNNSEKKYYLKYKLEDPAVTINEQEFGITNEEHLGIINLTTSTTMVGSSNILLQEYANISHSIINNNNISYNNVDCTTSTNELIDLRNFITGNPNNVDPRTFEQLTGNKLPFVENISAEMIVHNPKYKNIKVFPSLFWFPYKNYVGRFRFFRIDSVSEIPEFTLEDVRLFVSNFNTTNNYLFYVSLKKINDSIVTKPIYDLAVMDFNSGNMKFIESNNDFSGNVITINSANQLVCNTIKTFDVKPRENITFQGVIQSNQEDLVSIKVNPDGKYIVIFQQDTSLQLNNYRNVVKSTNDGLYKNLNILI